MLYARVDVLRRQIHYASARHEPALLVRNRTGVIQPLDSTGTVLGLTSRSTYQQRIVSFEPGMCSSRSSDGITDAVDSEGCEFGQKGVVRIIQDCARARASDLVGRVVEEVDRFTRHQKPSDDRTAIAIRFAERAALSTSHEEAFELAFAAA